jgi:hypothetical protein
MTKNQKIALGCGGAGCLGLIVVAIAGGLIYYLVSRPPVRSRDYNFNVSTNRNSNSNDNSDFTTNRNDNDNSSNSNSSSSSASSISDEDKHRLYHAAGMTGDSELINRVNVKLGLLNEDFTPGDDYQNFVVAHVDWAIRNTDFINSINTAEKARAYVNAHIPD